MLFLLLACTSELPTDLVLTDLNPTSQTYQQTVSLADYEGRVSLWYFGHST